MDFPIPSEYGLVPLLEKLSAMLSPQDILAIAGADYGIDLNEHAEALRTIVRTLKIDSPLQWIPHEAVSLARWGDPEDAPEAARAAEHLRRAFSCAVLLIDEAQEGWHMGVESTIAALVESCIALGEDAAGKAADFLAWAAPSIIRNEPDQAPFLALAFLSLAMACPGRWDDNVLLQASDWMMIEEDEIAAPWRESLGLGPDNPWLIGAQGTCIAADTWKRIARGLEDRAALARRSEAVREIAALIGAMMD